VPKANAPIKSAVKSLTLTVGALAILGLSSPNASATPTAENDLTPFATAPACVELREWQEDRDGDGDRDSVAAAYNNCRYDVNLRFIWQWAKDGPCERLPYGWTRTEWRAGGPPKISELRAC
jgi:hypothetical protein